MRPVIIWGAGRIGRGFVADVFSSDQNQLVLVDIDRALIDGLSSRGEYTIFGADRTGVHEKRMTDFVALHTSDAEAIASYFDGDEPIVICAVFAPELPEVARMIAPFVARRARSRADNPMNFIMAVNMLHPDKVFASAIREALAGDLIALHYLDSSAGISASTFMCIAPDAPEEYRARDPYCAYNNRYHEQVVNRAALRGTLPEGLPMLRLSDRFDAEETRKLYTLNMAHALTSYLSAGLPLTYMIEAIHDKTLRPEIESALGEAKVALMGEFGYSEAEMTEWNERIIALLENPYISDDLQRLGADTRRKLAPTDRLVGTANMCIAHGGSPVTIARAIKRAFFRSPGDPGTAYVHGLVEQYGFEKALELVSGITVDSKLYHFIEEE